ncbi:hypothetical protein [Paenibacillus sp. MBLB4367]|uniref:hypothetical protein n=1 Tax=Paenibacillus sp. MBLB4367 TaxID=3384767 RepID=UPI0039084085
MTGKRIRTGNEMVLFPNLSVTAYYEPISQIICYDDLSTDDFVHVFNNRYQHDSHLEHAKTVIHEMCHYLDHISTLSGQHLLVDIYEGIHGLTSQREDEFWRIMKLQRRIKDLNYKEYYKQINGDVLHQAEWQMVSSIGCKFDPDGRVNYNNCLFFTNYYHNGRHVGRVPISVEALWETKAKAMELQYHKMVIEQTAGDSRAFDLAILETEYRKWMNDSELLTYAIAAQLVAKLLDKPIFEAFKLASNLATVSLNLPFAFYPAVKRPNVQTHPNTIDYLTSYDPGLIYYTFVLNLSESPEKANLFDSGGNVDTELILRINGLPDKKTLEAHIEKEMYGLQLDLAGMYDRDFTARRLEGIMNASVMGLDDSIMMNDPAKYINIANAQCLPRNLFFGQDDDLNEALYDRYSAFDELSKYMKRFVDAC